MTAAARRRRWRGARLAVKRSMDLVLSSIGLVLVSPVVLLVTVATLVTMGPPVLFRQERPGRDGRTFRLLKFRTMTKRRDARGRPLPDEERLTRLGRLLRRTSLDELPELVNVLRGDMSLVGPRPLLVRYLDRYTPEQARRHEMRPGLTGWAQVNGRNAISWETKFEMDVWYVDHWSLRLDLRIMGLTFLRVFRREGISPAGHATMPEFTGGRPGAGEIPGDADP